MFASRPQPLDVSFIAPFKYYYIQECDITLEGLQHFKSDILGEAFIRAAVPKTAMNGFGKFRIVPFNPAVFCEADFLLADVCRRHSDKQPQK